MVWSRGNEGAAEKQGRKEALHLHLKFQSWVLVKICYAFSRNNFLEIEMLIETPERQRQYLFYVLCKGTIT